MEVTTAAIRRAMLQSNRHHQQTNTQRFTGRMPFLSPNQQCQSTEGKKINYCQCNRKTISATKHTQQRRAKEENNEMFGLMCSTVCSRDMDINSDRRSEPQIL